MTDDWGQGLHSLCPFRRAIYSLRNSDFAASLLDGLLRTFGSCMDGDIEFLRESSAMQQLHFPIGMNQPMGAERSQIVGSGLELRLQYAKREDFVVNFAITFETAQFGLSHKKRDLSSFEAEFTPLACARVLAFRSAAGRRTTAGAIAAGDALAFLHGTRCWTKCMKHRETQAILEGEKA